MLAGILQDDYLRQLLSLHSDAKQQLLSSSRPDDANCKMTFSEI